LWRYYVSSHFYVWKSLFSFYFLRIFIRYLIPCQHVMFSQRRHITEVEIYGKNAERFLLLRPSFTNKNNNTDRYEDLVVKEILYCLFLALSQHNPNKYVLLLIKMTNLKNDTNVHLLHILKYELKKKDLLFLFYFLGCAF
jgi:hypothetical protein